MGHEKVFLGRWFLGGRDARTEDEPRKELVAWWTDNRLREMGTHRTIVKSGATTEPY
jgi:hypothetical protein